MHCQECADVVSLVQEDNRGPGSSNIAFTILLAKLSAN